MYKFLGATLLALVLLACSVNGHGWMSSPKPRGQYLSTPKYSWQEYEPATADPNNKAMVCRNDPVAPRASWISLTAGQSQSISLYFNAPHPGDCFVYLTYDGDKAESQMKWFKIWEQHSCDRANAYNVPIPSYLPSGEHVIFRWEWYALHVFPTVEYYVQCVDATMTGSASGALPQPQVSIPGHLPVGSGTFANNDNNYWWPYDTQTPFFTGPKLATLNGQPNPTPVTQAPTPKATPAPVTQAPTPKATPAPVTQAPTPKATPAPVTPAPTQKPSASPTERPATQAPTSKATPSPATQSPATQAPSTGSSGSLNGFCASKTTGDYCSPTDAASYVSCPTEQNRPCASGLVCQSRPAGGVDCVAARPGQSTQAPATQSPTPKASTQAPTPKASTQAPVTPAPTPKASTQAPTPKASTQAPATQAPGTLNGFCSSKARGDYCSPTDAGSYVSCPTEQNRPCASGLVCASRSGVAGVDCVASSASSGSNSGSNTGANTGSSTPTQKPPTAATARPGTSAPAKPVPSTMRKVIYIIGNYVNGNVGDTIKAAVDAGYTHVILSFWVNHGECGRKCAAYAAGDWVAYANKKSVLDYVHSKNAYLMISGGGAVDDWFSEMIPGDQTGVEIGTALANWAMANGPLDGVDLDLEGGITWPGAVQAAVDATNTVRRILGPNRLISHAPQAPYFHSNYLSVYDSILRLAGETIDFVNIQYYNQDLGCYDLYDQVFLSSVIASPVTKWQCFAGTSVNEIHLRTNFPLNKIVVGKYITDGNSNWVDPSALHDWVSQAYNQLGWEGGIMLWDWRTTAPSYKSTIFG